MALSLNQFAPNEPIAGMYVYQANLPQLHNVIISESQATTLTYGAIVTLDSTATNTDAPVVVQADAADEIFGVITFTPVKSQFGAGDRVGIARANDIIWLPAAGAISMGDELYFNSDNEVTATATPGDSIVGKAITSATAQGDYVQVELNFKTTEAS